MISPFYRKQALALKLLQLESRDLKKKVMSALPAAQARLIEKELARVAGSGDPIVVGPWVTEPGIELMFWIPFLRWFIERFAVDPQRVVAISRGGVRGWYAGVAGGYADAFDLVPVEELRGLSPEWNKKERPVEIHEWDRDLFERIKEQCGWSRAQWIHPALLFNFTRVIYNAGPEGDRLLLGMTRHCLLDMPPPEEILEGLPREFVAIRFYTQARKGALWDEPRVAHAVREFIRLLSERIPVVNLDPGIRFKDHSISQWDFAHDAGDRIWSLKGRTDIRRNLGVQSWLIARSKGFAGTLGGLSCIASVTGVPALTFTALDRYPFLTPYRRYSLYAFEKLGAKYAISNPLRADLPTLVDAFVQDITGGDHFPWPVGPDARADGGSSHENEGAFALVRVPDERWVLRKRSRAKLRRRMRQRQERAIQILPKD